MILAPLLCAEQLPTGLRGGQVRDLWMATPHVRVVFRAHSRSLTLAGVGGGGLVDAAPWGGSDGLVEAVPLVEGFALDTLEAFAVDNRWRVSGTLTSLPGDRAPSSPDRRAEVQWSADPSSPWIAAQGADALYLHPAPIARLVDGWVVVNRVVYGHDGDRVEDLGGAIIAHGASNLLIAPIDEAWAHRPGGGVPVSGTSRPTAEIEAWRADTLVGLLPVDTDGTFAGMVPADTTHLRAVASGHTPSIDVAPDTGLDMPIEGRGVVDLRLSWPSATPPRPIGVAWRSGSQRGRARIDPRGGRFPVPAGRVHLEIDSGPTLSQTATWINIPPDASRRLDLQLQPAITPPPGTRLATLATPDGLGAKYRALPGQPLQDAVSRGVSWVFLANDHLPARATPSLEDEAWLRSAQGVVLRHPLGGRIAAWPWSSRSDGSARGVPTLREGHGLEDVVRRAAGSTGSPRTLMVDLSMLAHRQRPWGQLTVTPALVELPSPGRPPFDAWAPWWDLLREPNAPLPVGPMLWVEEGGPQEDPDPVALETSLAEGRVVATTGPWLRLEIGGVGPGQTVPPRPQETSSTPHIYTVELDARGTPTDRVSLVGPGGLVRTWRVSPDTPWQTTVLQRLPDVVVAVAWSHGEPDSWAVTAPIRVRAPAGAGVYDTDALQDTRP